MRGPDRAPCCSDRSAVSPSVPAGATSIGKGGVPRPSRAPICAGAARSRTPRGRRVRPDGLWARPDPDWPTLEVWRTNAAEVGPLPIAVRGDDEHAAVATAAAALRNPGVAAVPRDAISVEKAIGLAAPEASPAVTPVGRDCMGSRALGREPPGNGVRAAAHQGPIRRSAPAVGRESRRADPHATTSTVATTGPRSRSRVPHERRFGDGVRGGGRCPMG